MNFLLGIIILANQLSISFAADEVDKSVSKYWDYPDFRDSALEDQSAEGIKKLNELQSRTASCSNMLIGGDSGCGTIIDITTPEDYSRYVFQSPRPYHLFLLMSMGGCCNIRKGHCNKDCGRSEASFKKIAASYHVLGEHSLSINEDMVKNTDEDKQPVYFAIIHCDAKTNGKKLLEPICKQAHKLENVPKIFHARSSTFKRRNNIIQFRPQHSFSTSDWNDHNKLFNWVQGFAPRHKLVLYQDLFARLYLMGPIVMYGSGALGVAVVGAILVRQLPILMVFGAAAIQWLGCSGITYNLIHGMNWHGHNQEYFARSNRSQYVYEGLLCSGLYMGAGLLFVIVIFGAKGRYKSMYTSSIITFLCSAAVIASFGCVWVLMSIYRSYKAGWYTAPGFMPPEGYRHGSLSVDRGFTQLNEYKSDSAASKSLMDFTSVIWSAINFVPSMQAYLTKKGKQFSKQVKKYWNSSDVVIKTHKFLIACFDMVYNPVNSLITGRSSSGNGKKKRR